MNKAYLTVMKAAELIDVSPWTIRKWVRQRKLRSYKFGGALRIKSEDLLQFAAVIPAENEIKHS